MAIGHVRQCENRQQLDLISK